MKNFRKNLLLMPALLVGFNLVLAQMSLTGEIRPRTEYRHGYQTPFDSVSKASMYTDQRTRISFGYSGENFKVGVSLQDVSVWGITSQLASSSTTSLLHEGWGQYWFCPKFSLKAGRQEISYDDERLFGPTNWGQQGRHHDALLGIFEDTASKFTFHFGLAFNRDAVTNKGTSYPIANSYKSMEYLWANKKFGSLSASLLFLNIGWQSPIGVNASRTFKTIGTHLEYKIEALFVSGRFYYQMSNDSGAYTGTTTYKSATAYMFGADVQYTIAKKFTIGAGIETMTGQSQTDTTQSYTEVNHAFNTLFGTGHKFNGYMDYYFAGNGHMNVGLQDIYIKLKYKEEKYWAGLDFHMFSSGADVLDVKKTASDTTGKIWAMDKNLGMEIDFTFAYNLNKMVTLTAGYSQYLLTETTAAVKGLYRSNGDPDDRQTANWAFLMLTFKPNFLK